MANSENSAASKTFRPLAPGYRFHIHGVQGEEQSAAQCSPKALAPIRAFGLSDEPSAQPKHQEHIACMQNQVRDMIATRPPTPNGPVQREREVKDRVVGRHYRCVLLAHQLVIAPRQQPRQAYSVGGDKEVIIPRDERPRVRLSACAMTSPPFTKKRAYHPALDGSASRNPRRSHSVWAYDTMPDVAFIRRMEGDAVKKSV